MPRGLAYSRAAREDGGLLYRRYSGDVVPSAALPGLGLFFLPCTPSTSLLPFPATSHFKVTVVTAD